MKFHETFGEPEATRGGKSGAHPICEPPLTPLVPERRDVEPEAYARFLAQLDPDALRVGRRLA